MDRLSRGPHWLSVWLMGVLTVKLTQAGPIAQSPMDKFALIGMDLANQAMDFMQGGAAGRHEIGFDMPFFSANSKTALKMGQAMRSDDNDSEDEDDLRRRKRSDGTDYQNDLILPDHPHLHRGKRSPCHTMAANPGGGTGGGGGGGDEVDTGADARRRRAQQRRRAALKKRNTKAKKGKSKKAKSRRRRQTEVEDLAGGAMEAGEQIGNHANQFMQKIRGVWNSFVNSMNSMVESMRQTFSNVVGGDKPVAE